MIRTLAISLSLKNTYRVNCILYALKQTPIVKWFLPYNLYSSFKLKRLANILSVVWEVVSAFAVKLLYFAIMLIGATSLYPTSEKTAVFFHILIFLTALGSFTNTYIFKPGKDKYYALVLLRMSPQQYVVCNYGYYILKTLVGFAAMGILSSYLMGLSIWQTAFIPLFVVGLKFIVAAILLQYYEQTKKAPNENQINYLIWGLILLLLLGAYGLPVLGIVLPVKLSMAIMTACILGGILSIYKVITFKFYHPMYREILSQSESPAKQDEPEQATQAISFTPSISSERKGVDYLNELFVKRHRKILWRSATRITVTCLILTTTLLLISYLWPNRMDALLLRWSPSFMFFIMYLINRGGEFTKAMYMNCDYSLLTYSFFKKPEHIFRLFIIRLHEIVKINLPPAVAVGVGLGAAMYANNVGDAADYIIWLLLSVCLSIFFSIHYLLIYYLLQPYTSGTHVKNGDYHILEIAPFFICLWIIKMDIPALYLGTLSIAMCVIYYFIAVLLVRKYAADTFRNRE